MAACLAIDFDLPVPRMVEELSNTVKHFGECHDDGKITIRLKWYKARRPLSRGTIVDTICHELAHLKFFNHGADFNMLYKLLLEHAKELGYTESSKVVFRISCQ